MPSFLKDQVRRFSRSSFRTEKSSENSSSEDGNNPPSIQSTSTNDTTPDGSEAAASLRPPVINGGPRRLSSAPSVNRYSVARNTSSTTLAGSVFSKSQLQLSPFAPRLVSIQDNAWVNQKILLVYGQIADPASQPLDGQLWVCHHQDSFPAAQWPVSDSHFKALIHLQPGPNRIRLDFYSPKTPVPGNGMQAHSSMITINYMPLTNVPPLELVVLMGKDSPGTFDAVPERRDREGNDLDMAIRKFRMAAYLWSAFTGEQMHRNGFGRRCFRFDEQWQTSTLAGKGDTQMRNEARVHVVRCDKTVAELRDADLAQQNPSAKRSGDLYTIAGDAVRKYFNMSDDQTRYVSVLLLDAHWDPSEKLIRGHAALGGSSGNLKLAIFGSHALQSYPASLDEVVPAFTDCTRTDMNHVANDCNECGSNWEAANIGIGAHMHETGHLFGCPHQANGVMLRDYTVLHRTFVTRESSSTRTREPGKRLCLQADECAWHRLDALRFRFHPCFKLPTDPATVSDATVQVWSVENSNVLISSASGIAWIEIRVDGDEVSHAHIEYLESGSSKPLPSQVMLTESELRKRLPAKFQKAKKISLEIFSAGSGSHKVEDLGKLISKSARVKLTNGKTGYRGSQLGLSQMSGSRPVEILFGHAADAKKLLLSVRIYHGAALDGMEFFYENNSSELIGSRGGTPGGSEFLLDVRKGEAIMGFYLRAGAWIDAVQIITTLGRRSPVYGNAHGGSGHTLIPPRGYSIAGISGSCANWLDGFSIIIAR